MFNETDSPAVRQRRDAWIEVPARYVETGHASSPVEVRRGTDDDQVILAQTSPHCEVSIADIEQALSLVRASGGATREQLPQAA